MVYEDKVLIALASMVLGTVLSGDSWVSRHCELSPSKLATFLNLPYITSPNPDHSRDITNLTVILSLHALTR